jgi:hypothetical protein
MKKRARIMLAGMFAFTLLGAFLAFKAPQGARIYTWNEEEQTCKTLVNYTITEDDGPGVTTAQASTTIVNCLSTTLISFSS